MLGLSTKVASGAQALMEAATYETMDDGTVSTSEGSSTRNFVRKEGADSDDDEV